MSTTFPRSGETDAAIEREWIRSPPETVKDDSSPPNLEADARRFEEPHAAPSVDKVFAPASPPTTARGAAGWFD